jgi:hypothetical protein
MKEAHRVVLCTLYVALLTIGPHFVISEYKRPILDRHPAWGSAFIQHTVAVGAIGYILSGFIGGDIKNRGIAFYTACGCVWAALSHALAALAVRYDQLWLFMLGQGFFDTLGGGCLMTVVMTHATAWIDPAAAASIVGGTVGLSAAGLSYAMAAVITEVSAEACLWGLTALACLAALVSPFFRLPPPVAAPELSMGLNDDASVAPLLLSRRQLICSRQFQLVWTIVALGLTPGFALISTYTALFETVLGISYFNAAIFTGVANATYCIGRVLGGIMCRQLGVKRWGGALLGFGVLGACLAAVAQITAQRWLFVSAVSMMAMQLGATQVFAGPLIVFVLGRHNLAAAYGLVLIAVAFASVVGPVAILAVTTEYVHAGNTSDKYNAFFYISSGILAVALSLLLPVVEHDSVSSSSSVASISAGDGSRQEPNAKSAMDESDEPHCSEGHLRVEHAGSSSRFSEASAM